MTSVWQMHDTRLIGIPRVSSGCLSPHSPGPARVAQVIREALARGADRAIHVEDDGLASADAFVTSHALAAAMKD